MALVDVPDGSGGTHKTLRISGVNVQIGNGLGATNGFPSDPASRDAALVQVNAAGNLIVGYAEPSQLSLLNTRVGSHTLSFGSGNGFHLFGGLLGGKDNLQQGSFGTISAGRANLTSKLSGFYNASLSQGNAITGGSLNSTLGSKGSISGANPI